VLVARERLGVGDRLVMRSIIDSTFIGTVSATTTIGERPAIVPTVSGTAWITGTHEHTLDPGDPWPSGYRLSDTWPASV
jgi:proline racemase